ncbi:MAG TPA: redoxin domain-containing protein [Bacteroidia bacterium]|jgi:thiol-disulfide isomerase/thioredoxin|nr:redoxin domain-containing protein [Bacteroidia bacterium]
MRWLFGIALVISLAFNAYFIVGEVVYYHQMEYGKILNKAMGGSVGDVKWGKGLEMFNDSVKKKYPELSGKKYFYINMWAMFCSPCIKEMPWLDSLSGTINRMDVAYIFLAGESDKATNSLIERKKFKIKNFVYLNNMNDFISSVYNEQKKKSVVYPTVLIIDSKGKIYHSSTGAFENQNETKEFVDLINKLK